jgi:hypothetical protein
METVTFAREADGVWRAAGHLILPHSTARGWKIAALCLAGSMLLATVIGDLIVVAYRKIAHGGWEPQPMVWTEPPAPGNYASLHVSEIRRDGNIVVFHLGSGAGMPAHLLTLRYSGWGLDQLPVTDHLPEAGLTALLKLTAPAVANSRIIFQDTKTARGPGEFRFGFVLPDADKAEMAVRQAREIYLGKTLRPGTAGSVFMLFELRRKSGMGAEGNEMRPLLEAELSVSPIVGAQPASVVTAPAPANRLAQAEPRVAAPTGSEAEIIRLKLAAALKSLDEQTARSQAGITTSLDVETARTDVLVLEAELAGDVVGVAKARLALAQRNLAEKTARYQAGLTTTAEFEAAKMEAAILEIRLREAEAPATPATTTSPPQP